MTEKSSSAGCGSGSGASASGSGKIAPVGQKEPGGESALRNASLRQDPQAPIAAAPAAVTYRQFKDLAVERLAALYPAEEARAIAVRLLMARLNVHAYKIAAEPATPIPADALGAATPDAGLLADLARLAEGCPLQYVLGFTEFCGLRIRVAPGCLIPRPETEELVSLIVENFGVSGVLLRSDEKVLASQAPLDAFVPASASAPDGTSAAQGSQLEEQNEGRVPPCREPFADGASALRNTSLRQDIPHAGLDPASPRDPANILDLCTGSGCIAYALADAFPDAQVFACDLSEAALTIACKQRVKLPGARPVFFQADVLGTPPAGLPKFDLIVSNPPYVRESERAAMRRNVLDYEPAEALFVPDDDPLRFYAAIRRWADALLAPGGELWLEINEALGPQTAALFSAKERTVELLQDLSGKDRFLRIL